MPGKSLGWRNETGQGFTSVTAVPCTVVRMERQPF